MWPWYWQVAACFACGRLPCVCPQPAYTWTSNTWFPVAPCDHCYCLDACDVNRKQPRRPHMKCCKCSDERLKP